VNKRISTLTFIFSTLLTSTAFAAQAVQVANNLYNNNAGSPGVTQTDVVLKFYTGSSILCDTRTVTYGGFVTIQPGVTGSAEGHTTCTGSQLITSVTATPITATAQIGSVYGTTPVSFTVTNTTTITQLTVSQTASTIAGVVTTSYAPIFNVTNGTVSTAGVPRIG
jgi:hypothetical protein